MLAEAVSVCLDSHHHPQQVPLLIEGMVSATVTLACDDVPPLSKNTYADMQDTTEYGAYGLGIVLASRLTGQPQQWSNRALLWVLCRRGLDWQPISFTFWTHPEMPPAVGKTKIPLATLY